jgi:hypothetical protein
VGVRDIVAPVATGVGGLPLGRGGEGSMDNRHMPVDLQSYLYPYLSKESPVADLSLFYFSLYDHHHGHHLWKWIEMMMFT